MQKYLDDLPKNNLLYKNIVKFKATDEYVIISNLELIFD